MPGLVSSPTSASTAKAVGHTAIFLHIPKTAGSTLSEIVLRQFKKNEVIWLRQPRICDSAAEFNNLPDQRKRELKFILGHVGYGLHAMTPNTCTYVTVLREPVDRVVSYYYYIRRTPVHFMYPETIKLSLKEFAASEVSHKVSNGMCKYLAEMDAKECNADTLATARKHVESFAVTGLIEQFDETLMLFKRALGWTTPYYVRDNVTKNRPKAQEIESDVRDVIIKHNSYDMELYEWAAKRFHQAVEEAGVRQTVASFRKMNKLYGTAKSAWGTVKSMVGKGAKKSKSGYVQP